MRKFLVLLIAALCIANVRAEQLSISMAYSNSSVLALPFDMFSKGRWQPDPQARFVKLHLYLDRPINLSRFEVVSCDGPLKSGVTVFANFDEWLWKVASNTDGMEPQEFEVAHKEKYVEGEVNPDTDIRSLTFNFEKNKGFSLCGINLYGTDGKRIDISVPRIVGGKVTASSTLAPQYAYDVMNLFDSRFESAWASNGQAVNSELRFGFDQPQSITKLRLWNGYQRSAEHCIANSRTKVLRLEGDGGYTARITVQDVMGAQEIALPKPYTGKSLRMTVEDAYRGKAYADLVISELRFGNNKGWFMLDPLPHIREGIMENRRLFHDANLSFALDDGFINGSGASLRLRSDGSFYLSGYQPDGEDESAYFAMGNYEIKEGNSEKGLQLRLFGLYHNSPVYGDCNGCGRDCNRAEADKEKIFQELVWLKPGGKGGVVLVPIKGKHLDKASMQFNPEPIGEHQ